MTWTQICKLSDIVNYTGVAALVGGKQIAIFRIDEQVFALSNLDPFTKQNVISRGIVGSKNGKLKVASPLLKHNFFLETGEYSEDPSIKLETFAVKLEGGEVSVATLEKEVVPS